MTIDRFNPSTIAAPIGAYSHGVIAPAGGRWLHISGQIGNLPDGSVAQGFAGQARAAWANLVAILAAAEMDVGNLVKVTTFLTDADAMKELGPIRLTFLGDVRPASTLLIVKALARPDLLIEVEAIAHRD